jgi:aspartate/glutamate racemase
LRGFQSQKIETICNSLSKEGAENILVACTGLPHAMLNMNSSIPIIDTTEILINASVRELIKI